MDPARLRRAIATTGRRSSATRSGASSGSAERLQADPRLSARYRLTAQGAGALTAVIGACVLAGWLLDVEWLKSWLSAGAGSVGAKANAGLGLVLLGSALLLIAGARGRRRLMAAQAMSALVVALGLVTLAEWILGWSVGIDQLLFSDPLGGAGILSPGRMAPNSAIAFVVLGSGLLGLRRGRLRVLGPLAACVTLCLGFAVLLGYVTSVTTVEAISRLTQMAVPMAVGLILASLGVIFLGADRGPFRLIALESPGGALVRRLIPTVVAVILGLGLLHHVTQEAGVVEDSRIGAWLLLLGFTGLVLPAVWHLAFSLDRAELERLRVTQALAHREQQYRTLSAGALEAIVSAGENGAITFANPAAERMFEWEPGALIGQSLTVLMPERLHRAHRQGIEHHLAGGKPRVLDRTVELVGITREGEEFPLELSLSASAHEDGPVFTAIMRDITRRRRSAQRRAAEYGAARALAEAAGDEAVPRVLEEVGRALGWRLAAAWRHDLEAGALRIDEVWAEDPAIAEGFEAESREFHIPPGQTVPGRAWSSGGPEWIADAPNDDRFQRKPLAARLGLRGIVCVPIGTGERSYGVMELCSREPERPDEELLSALSSIGAQLGHYLQRSEADRDLREAKAALEREHRFTAALLDNLDEGVVACDADGRLALFNRATRALHGISQQSLPPERWAEHYDLYRADGTTPMTTAEVPLFRALEGERVEDAEMVVAPRNGEPKHLLASGQAFVDAEGNRLGAVVSMRDVTARRRAEQATRASEQRLRTLVENLPDTAVLQFDHELRYTLVAGPGLARLGYDAAELEGRTLFEVAPPDRAAALEPVYRATLAGEECAFEYQTVNDRWLWLRFVPLPDGGGGMAVGLDITERKRGEEAVLESERRYRSLATEAPVGIWENDLEGDCTFASDLLCQLAGISREEALSGFLPEMLHHDDREMIYARWARMARGEERSFNAEYRFVHRDGSTVWVVGSAFPLRGDDGEITSYVGTCIDITARKEAEAALEQAEQRFRSAFEEAPIGMAMTDADGVFVQVNRALERLLGRNRRDLVGKRFDDITHPDEVALRRDDLDRLMAGEVDAPEVECRYIHAKGHAIPVAVSISVVRNSAGSSPLALAQIQDLTERRRAEAALRLQSEITANMAEGVCLVRTADTQIVYANRSFEEMFGYAPGELLGQPVAVVNAPGEANPAEAASDIQTHVARHGRWVGEVHNMKKDGTEFWCLANVANFDHPEFGEVSIAVHADITERKEWEREIARARDDALEGTRLKSEFLANMSHEIRTPMNGIIGMTGLLLDSGLDAEQREYADLVRSSGESLLAILNDILDFSKIEAGKLDLDPSDFRLGDAVEDVVDLLAERARAKGVELSVLVESDVPGTVTGDEGRVRQILLNLVSNAVKFTERGEIRVSARVADGGLVRFEVADTGIGIAAEDAVQLFDSFAQGDSSTSRRYGGTGLGLAIAKQLVEMMDGEIGVASALGRGSSFWFSLPLTAAPESPGETRDPGGRTERLHGRRLLIVDDSATNRRIVAHHAASWGMVVDEAEDGASGLELMRTAASSGTPIEIVALDMHMPDMDGLAVARAVRSDPALRRTQILLVSSTAGRPADLREHGLDDYLPKPVRRARLRRAFLMLAGEAVEAAARARRRELGRGLSVLIAEDNPVNQRLAARMLEKRGLRSEIVENGRLAVEAVERGGHAAVLMDCQMPGMDGYEATREIRRREPAGQRIPVIAMTAHSMHGDRERCLEAGMDDYLSKPLDVEAFDAALARWLPRAAVAGESGRGVAVGGEPGRVATGAGDDERGATGNGGSRAGAFSAPRFGVDGAPGAPPRASPAPAATATDPDVVARVRGEVGDELYASLAEMLVTEATAGLAAMRAALAAGEASDLGERAHKLKGGSSSLGASAMADTARRLQDAGRSGELAGTHDLLDQLERELELTRTELGA